MRTYVNIIFLAYFRYQVFQFKTPHLLISILNCTAKSHFICYFIDRMNDMPCIKISNFDVVDFMQSNYSYNSTHFEYKLIDQKIIFIYIINFPVSKLKNTMVLLQEMYRFKYLKILLIFQRICCQVFLK